MNKDYVLDVILRTAEKWSRSYNMNGSQSSVTITFPDVVFILTEQFTKVIYICEYNLNNDRLQIHEEDGDIIFSDGYYVFRWIKNIPIKETNNEAGQPES